MKEKMKKLIQTIPIVFLVLSLFVGFLTPTIGYADDDGGEEEEKERWWNRDADHSGSVFINAFPQSGSGAGISAFADGTATQNKLFAQDTLQSAEVITTGILFAHDSYRWNSAILEAVNKSFPAVEAFPITTNMFSDHGEGFAKSVDDWNWVKGRFGDYSDQTRVLTMSIPGWTASNDLWDPSSKTKLGNRKDMDAYRTIPADTDVVAGGIIDNLIGGMNQAMQYFDSYVTLADGTRASYDHRGILHMATHIAKGQFPKPGSKVIYDPESATFSSEGGWANVKLVGNPALSGNREGGDEEGGRHKEVPATAEEVKAVHQDGTVLAYIEVDSDGEGEGTDQIRTTARFPYIVSKAPTMVNSPDGINDKYYGDVYALSYMDVVTSMAGSVYVGEGASSDTSSNTSIVADQIDSYLYNLIMGALSALGVQSVDDLLFGEGGNLFRNNAYYVFLAITAPFIIIGVMILFTAIADAFRKSQLQYINTQQAGEVQDSVGNVVNALLQIALLPSMVRLFVMLDQVLVDISISLHDLLNSLIGYHADARRGLLGGIGQAIGGGMVNIAISILMAGVNIKFMWRYVARSISFAIYFMLAPVQFALDAFNGNGQFLQISRRGADTWKNLASLSLMRGIDAFGIVLSTTIGRLLFGNKLLVTLLGYMTITTITDSVRNSLGLTNATIGGIAETGDRLSSSVRRGASRIGAGAAGAIAYGAQMGRDTERNKIDRMAAMGMGDKPGQGRNDAGRTGGMGGGSSSDTKSMNNFNSELTSVTAGSGGGSGSGGSSIQDAMLGAEGGGGGGGAGSESTDVIGGGPASSGEGGGGYYSANTQTTQEGVSGSVDVAGGDIAGGDIEMGSDVESAGDLGVAASADFVEGVDGEIDEQDPYALAKSNMGEFNPGALDANTAGRDDDLSQVHRGGFMNLQTRQNMIDEDGMAINKNTDYTNLSAPQRVFRNIGSSLRGGYDAGAGKGVALDPRTKKTMSGVSHYNQLKYTGPEHYAMNEKGHMIPISGAAKRERFTRLAAGMVGGAASALSPKNLAMSAVTSSAIALSSLTDTKIDDAIAISAYGKQLESRRTGENSGIVKSLGGSIAGRMLKVDPKKFAGSRLAPFLKSQRQSYKNPGFTANTAQYQTRQDSDEQHNPKAYSQPKDGRVRQASSLDGEQYGQNMKKSIQYIQEHAAANSGLQFNEQGHAQITQDSLRQIAANNEDVNVKNHAYDLMDNMGSRGYESMLYDQNNQSLGGQRTYYESQDHMKEVVQADAGLNSIQEHIDRDPNSSGFYQSMEGSQLFQHNQSTGGMTQYSQSEEQIGNRVQAEDRQSISQDLRRNNAPNHQSIIDELYNATDDEAYHEASQKAYEALGGGRIDAESGMEVIPEESGGDSSSGGDQDVVIDEGVGGGGSSGGQTQVPSSGDEVIQEGPGIPEPINTQVVDGPNLDQSEVPITESTQVDGPPSGEPIEVETSGSQSAGQPAPDQPVEVVESSQTGGSNPIQTDENVVVEPAQSGQSTQVVEEVVPSNQSSQPAPSGQQEQQVQPTQPNPTQSTQQRQTQSTQQGPVQQTQSNQPTQTTPPKPQQQPTQPKPSQSTQERTQQVVEQAQSGSQAQPRPQTTSQPKPEVTRSSPSPNKGPARPQPTQGTKPNQSSAQQEARKAVEQAQKEANQRSQQAHNIDQNMINNANRRRDSF